MEPENDPKLTELLREWKLPEAPKSLDDRILNKRQKWWNFLLMGSIRVPVPVGIAILGLMLVMAVALARQGRPSRAASPLNLVDFLPVKDPQVRVIQGPL